MNSAYIGKPLWYVSCTLIIIVVPKSEKEMPAFQASTSWKDFLRQIKLHTDRAEGSLPGRNGCMEPIMPRAVNVRVRVTEGVIPTSPPWKNRWLKIQSLTMLCGNGDIHKRPDLKKKKAKEQGREVMVYEVVVTFRKDCGELVIFKL